MKKIIDILEEIEPDEDFRGSEDFISDGLIDSVDLQRLISALEEEYGVHLAGTDLMPQNFANVESIRELLANYDVKGV